MVFVLWGLIRYVCTLHLACGSIWANVLYANTHIRARAIDLKRQFWFIDGKYFTFDIFHIWNSMGTAFIQCETIDRRRRRICTQFWAYRFLIEMTAHVCVRASMCPRWLFCCCCWINTIQFIPIHKQYWMHISFIFHLIFKRMKEILSVFDEKTHQQQRVARNIRFWKKQLWRKKCALLLRTCTKFLTQIYIHKHWTKHVCMIHRFHFLTVALHRLCVSLSIFNRLNLIGCDVVF